MAVSHRWDILRTHINDNAFAKRNVKNLGDWKFLFGLSLVTTRPIEPQDGYCAQPLVPTIKQWGFWWFRLVVQHSTITCQVLTAQLSLLVHKNIDITHIPICYSGWLALEIDTVRTARQCSPASSTSSSWAQSNSVLQQTHREFSDCYTTWTFLYYRLTFFSSNF